MRKIWRVVMFMDYCPSKHGDWCIINGHLGPVYMTVKPCSYNNCHSVDTTFPPVCEEEEE